MNLEVELCREMKALRAKVIEQNVYSILYHVTIPFDEQRNLNPSIHVYHGGLYVTCGFITDTNVVLI